MSSTIQMTEKYIDPFRVALFLLMVLLATVVYTYVLIELFGMSEFASMSQTNVADVLILGASSTIAFIVWKRFEKSKAKTVLLFGVMFQSLIMIGVITINNYISIYPIVSAPFQDLYWIGWVVGIIVQPVVALGVVLSVKKKLI